MSFQERSTAKKLDLVHQLLEDLEESDDLQLIEQRHIRDARHRIELVQEQPYVSEDRYD